ncbi:hypothetical protein FS837_008070, partial [Tulasnella sp. UAMH 9824]
AVISAVISGRRPARQPTTAPDGTSYSALWEEASACWAGDPNSRPRIADVLRRLNRDMEKGAQNLVIGISSDQLP